MSLVERTAEGSLARLPAHFGYAAAQSFTAALREELAAGVTRLVLDFRDTDSIDSSAIGALVSIAKDVRTRSGSLLLRNLNPELSELFFDTGLDKIFDIEAGGDFRSAEVNLFETSIDIRLDIKNEIAGDACILHLSGIMNHPQGSRYFKEQFLLALARYRKILLDLEELTFFDSLSVSVVLGMNKLIKETGGSLRLCGANYIVNDLFSTLNLHRIIPMYTTVADSLRDWT